MVTAKQIRPLLGAAADTQVAKDLEVHLESLRLTRDPLYLDAEDLIRILRWKLRGQYGRQQKIRAKNTEDVIRTITTAAFSIHHADPDYEVDLKVTVLGALRGVGVPVASAILALVEPTKYGVIDFRGWRQLFGSGKTAFEISDYKRYLAKLRKLAQDLQWRVRDVDEAVWELDQRRNGGAR